MSQHNYADTKHLLMNFILNAPLTPALKNTKTLQFPDIIVTESAYFLRNLFLQYF